MLQSFLLSYLALLSIFGYSYFYKKIVYKKNNIIISNKEFFYGVLIITFLSLLINLLFPLKFFTLMIFLIGIFFFFNGLIKKIYKVNFFLHLLIIIIISFIIFYNGPNVDSPMYHLQLLNWITLNKIALGITNLNIRFGMNSSWHSFLALMNIEINTFSLKYYLSSVIFSILVYEVIEKKFFFLSDVFLFLSLSFLLFWSFIHPFVNGPILNQLGNPEVDTVAMFYFLFCFYIFLKLKENNYKNNILINFFIIIIFLAVTTKLSNISLLFLLILVISFSKNYKFLNLSNVFVFITGLLWVFRSFLISGCFFFPIKITCFKTLWTNIHEVNLIEKIIQSFSRDTRLRNKYMDFDYTLNSNDWFLPWFNDYFMNSSILKISSLITLLSIFSFIFLITYEKLSKYKKNLNLKNIFIIIFFLLAIYIWLKAPEVRFGSGLIIALPCFLLAILIYKLNYYNYALITYKTSIVSTFFLLFLLSSKHLNKFQIKHLIDNQKFNNYDDIISIGIFDGIEIFQSKNWQCGDFPKVCVNEKKNNYRIINKYNYKIFLSDKI